MRKARVHKAPKNENPAWTARNFARARPLAEVLPDLAAASRRARGRPKLDNPKQQITLRLDRDVLKVFRATGSGWHSRINEALRRAVRRELPRLK